MCGILGEYRFDDKEIDDKLFNLKLKSIKHRGPDGNGVWRNNFCALGHVRLSIIDLSDNGAQPMVSSDEDVLSYNGELYNFKHLKNKIDSKVIFKSSSDTEVLFHLLKRTGAKILNDLRGMFAFAFFDSKKEELLLVRDQIGIKPLYYHLNEDRIIFGSEIKTILTDSSYQAGVNNLALKEHLILGFSVGEQTIFDGIKRLEPGHLLKINKNGVKKEKYFDPVDFVSNKTNDDDISVDKHLLNTVDLHSVSDVKLGMMLSGGIDSNLLLKYLDETNNLNTNFKAYNAGIEQKEVLVPESQGALFSERSIAKMMADKFHVELENINILPETFISVEEFIKINEEPICNPSGFLINEICQKARTSGNKVLFSGHGGDELFAGYRRHVAAKIISNLRRFRGVFKFIPFLNKLPNSFFRFFYALKNKNQQFFSLSAIGLQFLNDKSIFIDDFITKKDLKIISDKFQLPVKNSKLSILKKTMLLEFNGYLGAQNLINMDKFSMHNSIEVRVPFLNLDLMKKGFSIKDSKLIQGIENKSILRNLAKSKLPSEVFKQKKSGFGPSLEKLLYSEEVKELLQGKKTKERKIINVDSITPILNTKSLDSSLMMQLLNLAFIEQWFRTFID